ncbi:PLC-like phosphodiesterase [Glarea lozoyensis ATCC 20868]|uniref:Altered inheritance of mitochondria protein 6 n=1 Tax=Glarea lozoyensis (strain ATCC 20868 / MF5171) TaxID=1116229 RepID=S3DYE0_GLAL2|nr:PLC-like phosphodiesterase [Glarea lozoyensis ATCC 20868]EPE36951.1 PLC-like phosphodiesterase [Glarea lozoyensis ATCC 20868]
MPFSLSSKIQTFPKLPRFHSRSFNAIGEASNQKRVVTLTPRTNSLLCVLRVLLIFSLILTLIWIAMVLTLTSRLAPNLSSSGVADIVRKWQSPADSVALLNPWNQDFTRDTTPVSCHSHNDYWRKVPLYSAISAGCVSVEADIWFHKNDTAADLLVGHDKKSLTEEKTLQSLYLNPFLQILENMNKASNLGNDSVPASPRGIFDKNPEMTTLLLLDFKSDGPELWPIIQAQLEPLRVKRWLTYWESSTNKRQIRPITVVATGNAHFDLVTSNTTYRDIFFDAPLTDIKNTKYTNLNSYLASASLGKAIGTVWAGNINDKQRKTLTTQINDAKEKGLITRYWDTPSWPVSWRNSVWKALLEVGSELLNVDDLEAAAKWNWDWCVVAGLVLCG